MTANIKLNQQIIIYFHGNPCFWFSYLFKALVCICNGHFVTSLSEESEVVKRQVVYCPVTSLFNAIVTGGINVESYVFDAAS